MSNTRLDLYKEAMSLEVKRTTIQAELDQVVSRLARVQADLFTGVSTNQPVSVSKATPRSTLTPSRGPRRISGRGELKSQILETLSSAGATGVRVKDLAASLGAKPANIYAWFQFATKRMPQIKKIGAAHYRLEGSASTSEIRSRGRSAKPGKRRKQKRGHLAEAIMDALKAAGAKGMKVRELAEELGTKYQNLSVWFATTGKKNKSIKKIGEAHYRLA